MANVTFFFGNIVDQTGVDALQMGYLASKARAPETLAPIPSQSTIWGSRPILPSRKDISPRI